jgi:O-antigen/teichoic acid export membrane protein
MLRIAILLAGSRGVLALMRFGRNVFLARLIGVEDFGIASTFALLMAVVQMLSDIGLRALVVQDREGDSPGFIDAIHGLSVLRGALLAAAVFALADPIAALLGQPGLGWAYRIFAVLPLLRAFAHLDPARQQRAMRFGLTIKVEFAGLAASIAALPLLWLWLGDFRVMLGLLFVEGLVSTAVAFLLSERPYRLGWSGAVAARALRFGWPVLLGGVLTFAIMQGERLIVANQYSATDLGLFSAALTLAMAPTLLVQRVIGSMVLPMLARDQDNERAFLRKAELALETLLASGLGLMLVFVLAGPSALRLIYGAAFATADQLVAILGVTFALRMVRGAAADISMAKGHTANLLIPNAVRFVSFPVAFLIALRGGSLEAIALTSVAGEAASLLAAYAFVAAREGLGPVLARRVPLYAIALAAALLLTAIAAGLAAGPLPALCAAALFAIAVALCRRFLRYTGDELRRLLARRR